ncbi:MAG: putative toxin-antitoxin system toxin component, PIN family [Ktedonobacteraceae bacterium]
MSLVVVPDACVLFPAPLRDTILRAAQEDLYQVRFTEEILEEVRRNLVKHEIMPPEKAQYLIAAISKHFEGSFVSPRKSLIKSMPNHPKDRHVLAAAVASKAGIIVTSNLKDFPNDLLAQYEVEAQSPDVFLTDLFHSDIERMARALVKQASALRKPSMTVPEVLERLKLHAPQFVDLVNKEFTQRNEHFGLRLPASERDVR